MASGVIFEVKLLHMWIKFTNHYYSPKGQANSHILWFFIWLNVNPKVCPSNGSFQSVLFFGAFVFQFPLMWHFLNCLIFFHKQFKYSENNSLYILFPQTGGKWHFSIVLSRAGSLRVLLYYNWMKWPEQAVKLLLTNTIGTKKQYILAGDETVLFWD